MTRSGPIETAPSPSAITARLVSPGARPRLAGYDVRGDLARHYGVAELISLSLRGELFAEEPERRAMEVLLWCLSPITIAEAPAHAGSLARLVGAAPGAVIGTAALTLGEESRSLLEAHADALAWISAGATGAVPEPARARDDEEREAVRELFTLLGDVGFQRGGEHADALGWWPALFLSLHALGFEGAEAKAAVLVWARLPAAMGEAFLVKPGRFRKYPMNTPAFEYVEGADEGR